MSGAALEDQRILVTGAKGSIGTALVEALERQGVATFASDRDTVDVTEYGEVRDACQDLHPSLIFHLAGAKHAPLGEEDPWQAVLCNISGTGNVLEAAELIGAHVVTASTCKACNPETAYGATKLIAERMTLNAGGSVARFYNVRETCGNVFDIWRGIPADESIPVTPCFRRFISIDAAVSLLILAAISEPGRYTAAGVPLQSMDAVAAAEYPGRPQVHIPPRRGDRLEEPECATQEWMEPVGPDGFGLARVLSPHDAREQVPA